jgi:hypothetical protein
MALILALELDASCWGTHRSEAQKDCRIKMRSASPVGFHLESVISRHPTRNKYDAASYSGVVGTKQALSSMHDELKGRIKLL